MRKDGSSDPIPWLVRARYSGEYSNVRVRVGMKNFDLHLLPLLCETEYFRWLLKANPAAWLEPKLAVHLPDFPGGEEIFDVVVDHCYGLVEHGISIENVVKVVAASSYLGVESLKSRALKFLEENVFHSCENCLDVLATFDSCKTAPIGDELYELCKKAFVARILEENPLSSPQYVGYSKFCNVGCLADIMAGLPANMAMDILNCILDKEPVLYFRAGVKTTESSGVIILCARQVSEIHEDTFKVITLTSKLQDQNAELRALKLEKEKLKSELANHMVEQLSLHAETVKVRRELDYQKMELGSVREENMQLTRELEHHIAELITEHDTNKELLNKNKELRREQYVAQKKLQSQATELKKLQSHATELKKLQSHAAELKKLQSHAAELKKLQSHATELKTELGSVHEENMQLTREHEHHIAELIIECDTNKELLNKNKELRREQYVAPKKLQSQATELAAAKEVKLKQLKLERRKLKWRVG